MEVPTSALVAVLNDARAQFATFEAAQEHSNDVSAEIQAFDTATQILADLSTLLASAVTAHVDFTDADIASVRLQRVRDALSGASFDAAQPQIELF